MPITSTNQPKDFLSFSPDMNLERKDPRKMPKMDSDVNSIRKVQSMVVFEISPAKPISDLAAMTSSEVPTAIFMGSFASKTSAGMIRNPPPAPTTPVSIPTTPPFESYQRIVEFGLAACFLRLGFVFFDHRIRGSQHHQSEKEHDRDIFGYFKAAHREERNPVPSERNIFVSEIRRQRMEWQKQARLCS